MKRAPKATWTVCVITERAQFTPYEGKSEQFARHDLMTARQSILITGGTALITLRADGALIERVNVCNGQYVTDGPFIARTPAAADAQTIESFRKELGK